MQLIESKLAERRNGSPLRKGAICKFLSEAKPHVLCLQEIKCRDGEFPAKAFKEAGYRHLHVVGRKGWHGVAIVSRVKLEPVDAPAICPKKEARIAAARIDGVEVHNLYVPAGADLPELTNPKFVHKLKVLDQMKTLYKKRKDGPPTVLVGDLNVAPGEFDVWSHRQLLNVVSHTPGETDRLNAVRDLVIPPFSIPSGREKELLPRLQKIANQYRFLGAPLHLCFDEIATWEDSSAGNSRFLIAAIPSSIEQCRQLAKIREYYFEKFASVSVKASCSIGYPNYNPHISLLKDLSAEDASEAKNTFCPLLPLTWVANEVTLFGKSNPPISILNGPPTAPPG